MSSLKRITACVLTAAIVFQLAALRVSAASALTGYSGNSSILRIHIAKNAGTESDFVAKFPKKLSLLEGKMENPLEQILVPAPVQYQDVPNFFQINYDDILYGDGTVESCGSSITALAMAATYLTGYDYRPDVLSRWFAGKKDEDIARLTYASTELGLSFATSQDWEETLEQLKAGKLIVAQTDSNSVFGGYSHFVVLKGMTKDGKILVNDPSIENTLKEELKEKYETGFEEPEIGSGFRYAWIFDQRKVPVKASYYKETPASNKTRYETLKLTPAEKQLLARVVCVNGHGECEEGQQMMIEVILNRLLSKDYPNELKEIIYGEEPLCDVALLNEAELTQTHYLVVERALHGPYQLDKNVTDFTYVCHK